MLRLCLRLSSVPQDNIQGADAATGVPYNVRKEVRTAIEKIGGTSSLLFPCIDSHQRRHV